MSFDVSRFVFTERHSSHNSSWTITEPGLPALCFACAIEVLQKPQSPSYSNSAGGILKDLCALVTRPSILSLLRSNEKNTKCLCDVLIGLLVYTDNEDMLLHAIQIISSIVTELDLLEMIIKKSIDTLLDCCDVQNSLGLMLLLGRLIDSNPSSVWLVHPNHYDLLQYLVNGLACASEIIKSSIVYILALLCSKFGGFSHDLLKRIYPVVCSLLASAKLHELIVNSLILLTNIVKVAPYIICSHDRSNDIDFFWTNSFKRFLLSCNETVQLSGLQCISTLFADNSSEIHSSLVGHVSECLFEILPTVSNLLLHEVFCCLNVLSAIDKFYEGHHVNTGFQALIDSLSCALCDKDVKTAKFGLQLVINILSREPLTPQTLSDNIRPLLDVVGYGLQSLQSVDITGLSSYALATLLKSKSLALSLTLPLKLFLPCLSLCLTRLLHHITTPLLHNKHIVGIYESFQAFANLLTSSDSMCKQFLTCSCEYVLIPFFGTIDKLDNEHLIKSLSCLFRILHVVVQEDCASGLVSNLMQNNFIEFAMDLRKLLSTRSVDITISTTQLIETLICVQLKLHANDDLSKLCHTALSNFYCSFNDCIGLLSTKFDNNFTSKAIQGLMFCVIFITHQFNNLSMSSTDLLESLVHYITINDSIHVLPTVTVSHILSLYTANIINHSTNVFNSVNDILVKRIICMHNYRQVFINQVSLLLWGYQQDLLRHNVMSIWLEEWLLCSPSESNIDDLLNRVTCLTSLVSDSIYLLKSGDCECIKHIKILLKSLLNKDVQDRQCHIIENTHRDLLTILLETNDECRLLAVMEILCDFPMKYASVKSYCTIMKIINSHLLDEDDSIFCCGLHLLHNLLMNSDVSSQISMMILNESHFIDKILSHIAHSMEESSNCLYMSLKVITQMIQYHSDVTYSISCKLSFSVLFKLLVHKLTNIKAASAILLLKMYSLHLMSHENKHQLESFWNVFMFICVNLSFAKGEDSKSNEDLHHLRDLISDINHGNSYRCCSNDWSCIIEEFINTEDHISYDTL